MVSEDVGIIAGGRFATDYNFCERTLLTTDGGLSWVNIAASPVDSLPFAQVTDFTLVESAYIMTIEYDRVSEAGYDYAKYRSTDLNTWESMD